MSPGPDKAAPRRTPAFNLERVRLDFDEFVASLQSRLRAALENRFEIVRELGRGGSAVVFLARDVRTGHDIALKVLRPDVSVAIDEYRFEREFDIASHLQHPNILPVFDSGSVEGNLFYTMPYVAGDTLRARLRKQKPLPIPDVIAIARDISRALDHAHANGVVHRDIKPANILLDGTTTLVADFGIARAMTVAAGDTITESGVSIGTPEYMSPEQGLGEKTLEASSDIYALGCVVYEMLAGEPPFTGPSAQAIVARHCREKPRSLRIVRPAVPYGVQRAVEKALAKTPVDRFANAGAFVDALEQGLLVEDEPPSWRRFATSPPALAGAVILVLATIAVAKLAGPFTPELQANRVVVFPLYDAAAPAGANDGEGVATYIGNALGNARPLTWLDGWELLDSTQRSSRLSAATASRMTRERGARYYIDGLILRDRDSVRVTLTLHDVAGDSVVSSGTMSGAAQAAVLPVLGVRAAARLLPAIVRPGGSVSLASMGERNPRAIANFLQGEREYRRMQFEPALAHYQQALAEDSALTLAAVRAAHAANWSVRREIALTLAEVAVRGAHSLPPAQAEVARGLRFMLAGSADSAIAHLHAALRLDPSVHGAWTLIGETYLLLLPNSGPVDSLARAALENARAEDRDFAPSILLLETIALNAGRVRDAIALRQELKRAGADTSHAVSRQIALSCVRDGAASVDFRAAVREDGYAVIAAAKMLDGAGRQPACAIAAYTAVLDAAEIDPGYRWAAFLGLQAQFAATGRTQEAKAIFGWPAVQKLPTRNAYLILGESGTGFAAEAAAIADTAYRQGYDRIGPSVLWLVANWETRQRNRDRVRDISRVLIHKADSAQSRASGLASRAVAARVRLLDGDTAGAIAALRSLAPNAKIDGISWVPQESLGAERMLLAELLFARKDYVAARKVAALLDAPEPVIYPLYLRPSLDLRARAADADGQPGLAAIHRRRLADLAKTGSAP